MSGTSVGNARGRERSRVVTCRICNKDYTLNNRMKRTLADGSKTNVHTLACERRARLAAEEVAKGECLMKVLT